MKSSVVGFKIPSADLHKKSPKIFWGSIIISIILTMIIIKIPFTYKKVQEDRINIPPVIIHLENIPETRQRVQLPAPPKPFITSGAPLEVDEILPDNVTIEDTKLDVDTFPEAPPAILIPETGAAEEEKDFFEFYEVEEIPVRLKNIVPEYPAMAERAGIQGTVTLKVLINKTGIVDSVVVIKGPEIFRNPAIMAAKATSFSPAKYNNRTVSCWVIMPFRFALDE